MKPVKQTITIQMSDEPFEEQVEASVLGGLAVHPDGTSDRWAITHIQSGYAMIRSCSRNRAFSLRRALLVLPLDFTALDKDGVLAHVTEIKTAVADWFQANGGIYI